jgi:hypothetical protein
MSVLIFENFLDIETCNQLNDWVDLGVQNKWLDKGVDRGNDWTYTKRFTTRNYGDRFNYPPVVDSVFNKITDKLKVADLEKSVAGRGKNGVVVSYTVDGGDTYAHTDPTEGFLEVLRCNVLTRKPIEGGILFIGGKQIDLNVGDLHCYLPSTVEHYVTKTLGNIPRVLWMFGYQCHRERFKKIKGAYETDYKS